MLFTTILKQAVQLARSSHEAYQRRHKGKQQSTSVMDLTEYGPPSDEENALKAFLLTQKVATVYMLTAIMYLGRGDFDDLNLLDRYTQMAETFDSIDRAVGQMLEKWPLPDYLENGLTILAKAKIDIDEYMHSKI